ncbi:rab escort protein 1 isoform X1 [Ricinus communis]|uniref:rab escort protein 1 isoform X1 n=1 Tax=Ricinus communis TaxID=3988 RepID=UPI00201AC63B|nr:rab escort protein 1 isoform X1 [Ricinus communis]
MTEPPSYPSIDPTTFDLILIGTGLSESIIAAAASASGKSVLHIDQNKFYGSHFSSLSIPDLTSFLNSNSVPTPSPPPPQTPHPDFTVVNLTTQPLYSNVEISSFSNELIEQNCSKFSLDISGPRVLYCADNSIDLMIKTGANQYVEFKSIDASFVGDENGKLWNVPDSRAAIFKDKSLSLMEKNRLMRFFKLVQSQIATNENQEQQEEEDVRISEQDLESPFVDFLNKMKLSSKIKSIILYAIVMADCDQENTGGANKDLLKTKDGIDRLALYQSSIGRFTNALGAFIYPIYGQGELPPAFCRRAAVKGCIYVLRMPVVALLMDKNNGNYKGIRLASGQEIYSQKLVLDPSFTVPSSPSDPLHESFCFLSVRDVKQKVARAICITKCSLKPDTSNFLAVYPPRSLYPEQSTSIRALQMGGNLAVCPTNMFILYLSALCDDVHQGKKLLNTAMNALLSSTDSENPESCSTGQTENTEVQSMLLWSALYIQELTTVGQFDSISSTSMPDGNLDYNDVLDSAKKLFQKMYPNEEFFPETKSPESSEHDAGVALES